MNNRDRLISLLVDHALERRDVAAMLSVDVKSVEHWLRPPGSPGAGEPPTMAIELLEYKLAATNPDKPADRPDAQTTNGDSH